MIDQTTLQHINKTIGIFNVVSKYVALEKRGKNYFGLCPFHDEKTPSFSVSTEKNIARCFACNITWTPISFYQKMNNMAFQDAVINLAKDSGINLNLGDEEEKNKLEKYYQIMESATVFYQFILNQTSYGEEIKSVLQTRGINDDLMSEFRIGVANKQKNALYQVLVKEGYNELDMLHLGLIKEENSEFFDVFQNRIIFPISNAEKRIIGFSGRALSKDTSHKYVNSQETTIFKKSNILYRMGENAHEINKKDLVFITEGFFDQIAYFKAGVKNVVATMGTSLTSNHIKYLKKLTKNVVLNFDGDYAGLKATYEAIKKLSIEDFRIWVITLPDGLDPDSFYHKYSVNEFIKYIDNNRMDGYDFVYQYLLSGLSLDKPNDIKIFNNKVRDFIKYVTPDIKEYFTKKVMLSHNIDVSIDTPLKPTKSIKSSAYDNIEKMLVLVLIKSNNLISLCERDFTLYDDILNENIIDILKVIYELNTANVPVTIDTLLDHITNIEGRKIIREFIEHPLYKNNSHVFNEQLLKKYHKSLKQRFEQLELDEIERLLDTAQFSEEVNILLEKKMKIKSKNKKNH